jgi:2-polyprenyl-6-hydroxyphenyl methylase/3-demethylubiquinone-9 3-methyltransferase
MWSLGDYHQVGELLAGFGTHLVRACSIDTGQRVLDVGAGSGNVAIAAAAAGAEVVASDVTPELFAAGQRAAAALGVEVEWVEASAEELSFPDNAFGVVTSAVGAIFAPDHHAVADELLRVCRPGGVIGMINWPVDGFSADFLRLFASYGPPQPPGSASPMEWGTDRHLRELFADRVASLEISRHRLDVDHFATPEQLCAFYKATFGPTIATYRSLADDPDRVAALDRDFLDFAIGQNRAGSGERAAYEYPYVLVVARLP